MILNACGIYTGHFVLSDSHMESKSMPKLSAVARSSSSTSGRDASPSRLRSLVSTKAPLKFKAGLEPHIATNAQSGWGHDMNFQSSICKCVIRN